MTKAFLSLWFVLQCLFVAKAFHAHEGLRQDQLAASRKHIQRLHALSIHTEHSKELLGQGALVHPDPTRFDLNGAVRAWTRRALAQRAPQEADRVAEAILEESVRYWIDPVFLMAVIERESRFRPEAMGRHGEIGLMQLRPKTAEWIARKYRLSWSGPEMLKDPVANIRIGAAYFAFLRKQYPAQGDRYLSAYNMGPRRMREILSQQIVPKEYASDVVSKYVRIHSELWAMM